MRKFFLILALLCSAAYAETVPQELKNGIPVSSTPLTAGSGKVPVGSGTDFQEKTISGDATLANTGALTVTKTGGVNFATSATTDTTNASNISAGTLAVGRGGTGTGTAPSSGQLPIGNAGGTAYAPKTVSQDGTIDNNGVLTVTKTNNVAFAASATTDATNASNIASGALSVARIAAGTAAQFLQSNGTPATNWVSMSGDATLSNSGVITVTKTGGNNFAASATTDTTNASNITSGALAVARGGTGSAFTTFAGATATRTYTLPDVTGTIPLIGNAQTWSAAQTFGSGFLKLNGSTSGTITVQPVATAGSNTLTIPAVTGTVVTTGDSGTVTNAMLAGSIANANLANSTITIQGSAIALGGSALATSATPQWSAQGIGGAAGGANTIKFYGTTSGSIVFQPTAIAGSNTITLPAATGTVITTGDTGTVTNSMLAGSIDVTSKITGVTPCANGGTGVATVPTAGQLAVGNAGGTAYAPVTLSQDGTITSAGVLTVTKTNNVAFAASATTDATNANNISAGTLVVARGGTGIATTTAYAPICGGTTATGAWQTPGAGTTGNVFQSGGASALPTWGALNLAGGANYVSGILPAANGGTENGFTKFSGPTTATKTFTLPDASATILTTNAAVTVAQGGTGIASGNTGGIPYFSDATHLLSSATLTANALVIGGGAGTTPATLGSIGTATTVLHGNAGGAPSFSAVVLTTDVSGTLPIANGGTGQTTKAAAEDALSPITTKGDLQSYDGTHVVRQGVGTNGQVLIADSAQTTGLRWGSASGNTASLPIVITGSDIELGTAIAPTTTDANADVGIGASAVGKRVLTIQTKLNNTKDALQIQNSAGTAQYTFDNTITNNVDVKQTLTTANTASVALQSITENITIAAAATTNSSTNLIPANSFIVGVSYRVTTVVPTAATFKVGDTVAADRFGSGVSTAANTTSSSLLASTPCNPFGNAAATTILITPNLTPADNSGRIRVTVFYYTLAAPGN